jgi:carbamoyl-phosphate synthase large subunit
MPKRDDLRKILIIGSGPIVIGQGCEFDYSGTQACKALREEGYEVILINSNPATIMTDPEVADRTYIEPITPEYVEKIIAKERPDAVLPTLGGQTGLNTAVRCAEAGIFEKYGVEMIGAKLDVIKKAENRQLFKEAMIKIGIDLPRSGIAHSLEDAKKVAKKIGFPLAIRPSFTLGGSGGGFANDMAELTSIVSNGLNLSMNREVLIEESLIGWKEYEMEVMRDKKDNVVIICSIENFDPMGVHTGDSITVAPIQTLTDVEYQKMRDASIAVIREIGVETGGSNIQFAIDPKTGRMIVIEMNPRVSRSSALASKATGFPIAKLAAKLAVGYTLDEISNDITQKTPACFEPVIDYCVVKIPRFAFEKFPGANATLTTQMKSVGETMAIGRTFKEALQKGMRGLETGADGFTPKDFGDALEEKIRVPNADRLQALRAGFDKGMSVQEIYDMTKIDTWFLDNLKQIVELEAELTKAASKLKLKADGSAAGARDEAFTALIRKSKEYGFSDRQLARIFGLGADELAFRNFRKKLGVTPTYQLVDTCAAEFEAYTPYYYSSYESVTEVRASEKPKIMIIGGGPNRIGQGIEFDYCCCHASFALKEIGYETIMVNSNPETVSTDYDTSDRLYFEPVTFEDVMNIIDAEKPVGVIVQYGGQTPLNLAKALDESGVPIIGTPVAAIQRAEDRKFFKTMLDKLGLKQPASGASSDLKEIRAIARKIGYPVLLRPSFVLGGRAMEVVQDETELDQYFAKTGDLISTDKPVLVDYFLDGAIEVDVDLISDGETYVVGGVMEHIEEAGIHSGDSACCLPPHTLKKDVIDRIKVQATQMAKELGVIGLMNVQFAVKDNEIYVLEVNPRASRTVPFVSKAIGRPLAKLAAQCMAGKKLTDPALAFTHEITPVYFCVKEAVLPFVKFHGVDIILGPEMKSTGEVMGIDRSFARAYAKSQIAAGSELPVSGTVFLSVKEKDRAAAVEIGKRLSGLGFEIVATQGTANVLADAGITAKPLRKLQEGSPNVLDLINRKAVNLIINTPSGARPRKDEITIRSSAVSRGIPCITTIAGALASVRGIETMIKEDLHARPMQEYHREKARPAKKKPAAAANEI